MKKLLTAILTVAMLLTVTACGQNASPVGTTPSATPVETPEATPTPEVTPTPVVTPTPMATPTPQPTPVVTPTPQPLLDLSETESYQLERVTEESSLGMINSELVCVRFDDQLIGEIKNVEIQLTVGEN
ncbi:MAG: hypothetical protein J6L92_01765, partial [Clostridia bacterium]|nr:hypothetical protein [Clostridia bacterium]